MSAQDRDIVFLCQYFYPEYVSSATLPYDTAENLAGNGYVVGALCGYPGEYCNGHENIAAEEDINGIHIKRVKYWQLGRRGKIGRCINFLSFVVAVVCHINFLAHYKIIMVYSNPPVLPLIAMLAKKLFKNKLVFVSYDVYPEIAVKSGVVKENGLVARLFAIYNKKLFRYADMVVSVCKDMKDYLLKHRDITSDRITDIPNWYKDDGLQNRKKRSETRLFSHYREDDFIISYLGNLGTCQDADTIIAVFEALNNDGSIKFIFAGHGNKMPLIKEYKEKHHLKNVAIYDFLTGEDFSDILEISDCFVVSLIDGMYGLCAPSKTYSYLMVGRPVVCIMDAQSEIARDVELNNAGIVIKNGDANKMVKYIRHLRSNPILVSEQGKHARSIFLDKYEKEKCLGQYCDLVRQLLEAKYAA